MPAESEARGGRHAKNSMRMGRLMITVVGATGGTGGVVARMLLAAGMQVRAVSRSTHRLAPLTAMGAEAAVIESVLDEAAMTRAFQGAHAVYTMAPPTSSSVPYDMVGRTLARAVSNAAVSYVVNLSALGAHLPEVGGHLADYLMLEAAFDKIDGLNVLHLRPGFFMTSFFSWIDPIIGKGQVSGLLRGNLPVPRVSSRDIGAMAAEALSRLDFRGKTARELRGQRDISMNEAAAIIGAAIGNPSLRYVERTPQEWLEALLSRGLTLNAAQHMNEMYLGWNNGMIRGLEERSAANTTPTSFETFVAEDFLPRFKQAQQSYNLAPSSRPPV
jgi:uncharacterized protein YbjT (DUF2867 family)